MSQNLTYINLLHGLFFMDSFSWTLFFFFSTAAGLRRENQHIGSSQLLNRAYSYDPFYEADEKEKIEQLKIDFRRRKKKKKKILALKLLLNIY